MPKCPKCGFEQEYNKSDRSAACSQCGVVFYKYAAMQRTAAQRPDQNRRSFEIKKVDAPKSLPTAIGLNLLLPGAGYFYMGRVVIGIAAILICVMMALTTPLILAAPTWIGMNIIMAIDMLILSNKAKEKHATANLKKCPKCAEMIQIEAVVCRFCAHKY